jgi:hypothetical protein
VTIYGPAGAVHVGGGTFQRVYEPHSLQDGGRIMYSGVHSVIDLLLPVFVSGERGHDNSDIRNV